MWGLDRYITNWIFDLSRQELLCILALVMCAGFFCMRGFGSRSNY